MPNNRWVIAAVLLSLGAFSFDISAASRGVLGSGTPYTIDIWDTEDGLPQNSVIAMTQTRDGYLWVGTLNGLARFDGVRFTVFDESNTPGLNSSRIVSLFEDSRGYLWIGTETAGVALAKDGRVTSLDIGRGSRERRLRAICEDSDRSIWLYTADGELFRHRNGRVDGFWRVGADRFSTFRTVIAERSGALWVGMDWNLFAIGATAARDSHELPPVRKLDYLLASQRGGYWLLADGRIQKWSTNRFERDWGTYPWNRAIVSTACEDRQGNLVVGTLGAGLFWFDSEGKATCLSTNDGLSHNYILSLQADREGSLWVGTDGGGLNRVKRHVFDLISESRGLTVQSICDDAEGGLWIGSNGGGVGYWKEGVLRRFDYSQGLLNPSAWAVFVDRSQRVWAGTWDGLFQYQNGRFQRAAGARAIFQVVLAIQQDRSGRLWVGTKSGLGRWDEVSWKVFTIRDGLGSDVVRAIAEDREGNLWLGTGGGGLNRLQDGKFTVFRKQEGGLPSDDISSVLVDGDGVVWVGTAGNGLARLHGGKWTRYTTREGLVSNFVGYLIEDGQGYLWIGSNAGLMRVQKKALNDFAQGLTTSISVRAYGKPDGLPTRECTQGSQPAACRTPDGKLWFSTIEGMVSIDPAQLNLNTNQPPVMIESVLIDSQAQNTNGLRASGPSEVIVRAGKERLDIIYTSLNLAAAEKARFKYRLEGHETAWIEAGNSRIARYPKLPPGHYRFQVTACNEDGVWSETGSSLALVVEPPIWRTWWFLSIMACLFLGCIIAVVHYLSTQKLQRQLEGLRQQQALEKERSRIARDIHDQVGASLTQVALLGELVESDKKSPVEVEAHARQISHTARETSRALDEIVWTVNPSNDTLDGLISYVCKYAQEYLAVAGLRYRLDVPDQLPGAAISPEVRHNVFLASKEALTNIVRHARASSVSVRLRLEPTRFTLELEDDGRGPAGVDEIPAQSRNGLRNMRKRMEDIGGSFFIGRSLGGGTLVGLTAPVDNR